MSRPGRAAGAGAAMGSVRERKSESERLILRWHAPCSISMCVVLPKNRRPCAAMRACMQCDHACMHASMQAPDAKTEFAQVKSSQLLRHHTIATKSNASPSHRAEAAGRASGSESHRLMDRQPDMRPHGASEFLRGPQSARHHSMRLPMSRGVCACP